MSTGREKEKEKRTNSDTHLESHAQPHRHTIAQTTNTKKGTQQFACTNTPTQIQTQIFFRPTHRDTSASTKLHAKPYNAYRHTRDTKDLEFFHQLEARKHPSHCLWRQRVGALRDDERCQEHIC